MYTSTYYTKHSDYNYINSSGIKNDNESLQYLDGIELNSGMNVKQGVETYICRQQTNESCSNISVMHKQFVLQIRKYKCVCRQKESFMLGSTWESFSFQVQNFYQTQRSRSHAWANLRFLSIKILTIIIQQILKTSNDQFYSFNYRRHG